MTAANNPGSRRNADRGWHHQSRSTDGPEGKDVVRIAAVSAAVVGLIALAVYLLWPPRDREVTIMAGGVDVISDPNFPLNGFRDADVRGWREVEATFADDGGAVDFDLLDNALGSVESLKRKIAQDYAGRNLIVYLSGHLLPEPDGASLLLTQAAPHDLYAAKGGGRIKLRELLLALQESDAENVLVFLNATRLRPAWPLGIFTAEVKGQLQRELGDLAWEKMALVVCLDPLGLNFQAGSVGGRSMFADALIHAVVNEESGAVGAFESDRSLTSRELLKHIENWAGNGSEAYCLRYPEDAEQGPVFRIANMGWKESGSGQAEGADSSPEADSDEEDENESTPAARLKQVWEWAAADELRDLAWAHQPASYRELHWKLIRCEQLFAAGKSEDAAELLSAEESDSRSNRETQERTIQDIETEIKRALAKPQTLAVADKFERIFPGFTYAVRGELSQPEDATPEKPPTDAVHESLKQLAELQNPENAAAAEDQRGRLPSRLKRLERLTALRFPPLLKDAEGQPVYPQIEFETLVKYHEQETTLGTAFAKASPEVRDYFQAEVSDFLMRLEQARQWLVVLPEEMASLRPTGGEDLDVGGLVDRLNRRTNAVRLRNQVLGQLPDYARFVADRWEANERDIPTQELEGLFDSAEALVESLAQSEPDYDKIDANCKLVEGRLDRLQQSIDDAAPTAQSVAELVRGLEMPWISPEIRESFSARLSATSNGGEHRGFNLRRIPPRTEGEGAGLKQAQYAMRILALSGASLSGLQEKWNAWEQRVNGKVSGKEIFDARMDFAIEFKRHWRDLSLGPDRGPYAAESLPLWMTDPDAGFLRSFPPAGTPRPSFAEPAISLERNDSAAESLSADIQFDVPRGADFDNIVLKCAGPRGVADVEVTLNGRSLMQSAVTIPGETVKLVVKTVQPQPHDLTLIMGYGRDGTVEWPYGLMRLRVGEFVNAGDMRITYERPEGNTEPFNNVLPLNSEGFVLEAWLRNVPASWQDKEFAVTAYRSTRLTGVEMVDRLNQVVRTSRLGRPMEVLGRAQVAGVRDGNARLTFSPVKSDAPAETGAQSGGGERPPAFVNHEQIFFGVSDPQGTRTTWYPAPPIKVMGVDQITSEIIKEIRNVHVEFKNDQFRVRVASDEGFLKYLEGFKVELEVPLQDQLIESETKEFLLTHTFKKAAGERVDLFFHLKPQFRHAFEVGLNVAGVPSLYRWKIDPRAGTVAEGSRVRILKPATKVKEIDFAKATAKDFVETMEFYVKIPEDSGNWELHSGLVNDTDGDLENEERMRIRSRYRQDIQLKLPLQGGLTFSSSTQNHARAINFGERNGRFMLNARLFGPRGAAGSHRVQYGIVKQENTPSFGETLRLAKNSLTIGKDRLEFWATAEDQFAGIEQIGYKVTRPDTKPKGISDEEISWISNAPAGPDRLPGKSQRFEKQTVAVQKEGDYQLIVFAKNFTGKRGHASHDFSVRKPNSAQPGGAPATTGSLRVILPSIKNVALGSSAEVDGPVKGPGMRGVNDVDEVKKFLAAFEAARVRGARLQKEYRYRNLIPGKYQITLKIAHSTSPKKYVGEADVKPGATAALRLVEEKK